MGDGRKYISNLCGQWDDAVINCSKLPRIEK